MSQKGPTREECLQQVRDLEQRLFEAQTTSADLRSRLGGGAPAEVAAPEANQQLLEELQTANEELQSQAAELGIQAEELQVQAEELEMQNDELHRVSGDLETERALLHTVLEQMPAGVIIAEAPSGRFLLANQKMAAIIGRAVPLAKSLKDYDHYRGLHPDGRPFGPQDYPLAHCLTSGKQTLEQEINFIRADGSPGVIQMSASPVRNTRGEIIAGVATYQDITARKQAEREIQRLASFPQLNPNPVLEVNAAGQISYYNEATLKVLEALEAADLRVFLPDDFPDIFATARRTGQDNFQREVTVNGKVFIETISFVESLKVWRIYAIDITERRRAQEALGQSNKHTADILESISDGFFSLNKEMVVTYFNSAAARILGRNRDEVLGQKLVDAFPEARGSIFEEKYAEALQEGKPLSFEAYFEPKPYRNWYDVRVFPYEDGISVYFLVTTERKQTETVLRRAKQDWERTFDAVPDLITIIDSDHHMIRVNRAMARALGMESKELAGRHCYEFMHESGRIPSICPHQQLLADGREHTAEVRELNRDFLVTTSPIFNDDGTLFGSVHLARDITERKRAEEALNRLNEELELRVQERTAELRQTVEQLQNEVAERLEAEKQAASLSRLYQVLSRVNETIIRATTPETLFREVCRIAVEDGLLRMAWVGLTDHDGRAIRPVAKYGYEEGYLDNLLIPVEDVPECRGPTGTAVREGRYDLCNDFAVEPRMAPWREKALARGYRSSGAFPLRVGGRVVGALTLYAGTPGFFNQAEIALLEALADDLSFALESMDREAGRRRAEEEVKKLNEELEQRVRERTAQLEAANREMEAFSYSVSHDLKAPIRAIDGFSKMLMAEHTAKLDPEGLRLLGVVRHNTGYMAQLIEDLLALSRLGRREIRKTRLDLATLSAAVFKQIKGEDPGRRVALTVKDLPPACGDPSLMRQVLVNLLSNAFKFTKCREDAAIEVGGRCADGENVYYVKDNGVGFDMRYQEKLFGVFQRLHRQGEFEGTGVGLAIVQRILLRHGGRIWAEGQLGAGATFYFALPNREK
ncbi:MAG: PAS domain-containing protein [Desulfobaccales bacterium]